MPQVNVRMGPATISKLDALKEQYGSRSQVVAVAVDRLHRDVLRLEQSPPICYMAGCTEEIRCGDYFCDEHLNQGEADNA